MTIPYKDLRKKIGVRKGVTIHVSVVLPLPPRILVKSGVPGVSSQSPTKVTYFKDGGRVFRLLKQRIFDQIRREQQGRLVAQVKWWSY